MRKFTTDKNFKSWSDSIYFTIYADDTKIAVFRPHSIDILRDKAVVNYLVEYLDRETDPYTLTNVIKKDAASEFVYKILEKYADKEIHCSYTSHVNADGLYEVVNTKDVNINSVFNIMLDLMLYFITEKKDA